MPRLVPRLSETHARKAVELAAGQVAQRMAGKRVSRQENDVDQQYECPYTHSKFPIEIERLKHVFQQKKQEHHSKIQKMAMNFLQEKGKPLLAFIVPLPF